MWGLREKVLLSEFLACWLPGERPGVGEWWSKRVQQRGEGIHWTSLGL